jgi:hypothetical protein
MDSADRLCFLLFQESLWKRAGRITVGVWLGGGIGFLAILAGMMIWFVICLSDF